MWGGCGARVRLLPHMLGALSSRQGRLCKKDTRLAAPAARVQQLPSCTEHIRRSAPRMCSLPPNASDTCRAQVQGGGASGVAAAAPAPQSRSFQDHSGAHPAAGRGCSMPRDTLTSRSSRRRPAHLLDQGLALHPLRHVRHRAARREAARPQLRQRGLQLVGLPRAYVHLARALQEGARLFVCLARAPLARGAPQHSVQARARQAAGRACAALLRNSGSLTVGQRALLSCGCRRLPAHLGTQAA